jgi:hypothetical protein
MKKAKPKPEKVTKVYYDCGCKEVVGIHGLSNGLKCPNHRVKQSKDICREYPNKSDIKGN